MAQKKYIKDTTGYTFSGCELEGPIDEVIKKLTKAKEAATEAMYQNLTLEVKGCAGYSVLMGERLETDTEFNRRVKKEKAQRARNKVKREKKEEDEIKLRDKLIEKHGLPGLGN